MLILMSTLQSAGRKMGIDVDIDGDYFGAQIEKWE